MVGERKFPVRVLVVDDSLVCRELLSEMINRQPDMQTIGVASSGKEAIEINRKLKPDIITMDIQMPGMDGFTTIAEIMASSPVPILVATSAPVKDGVDQTFRAISAGALDLVLKPELDLDTTQVFIDRVRVLADVKVVKHRRSPKRPGDGAASDHKIQHFKVGAIAASTGGPKVLAEILGSLPHEFPMAFVVTQHLPKGFHLDFVKWLDQEVALDVRLAERHDTVRSGTVLVAPHGQHLELSDNRRVILSDAPPVGSHRPSADPMFQSVARIYGPEAIGIVLSGMGRDGANGLKELRRAQGLCIAQSEASCLVFGMPRAAIETGAADKIYGIQEIINCLIARGGRL